MILLGLALAAVATWLAVPPPESRAAGRLRPRAPEHASPSRGQWVRWLGMGAGFGVIVIATVVWGGRGAALATATGIVIVTSARLWQQHSRVRAALRAQADVAHACSLLASQLRVGRVPVEALHTTAEDCPVLAASAAVASIGGDPVAAWRAQSVGPGQLGLLDLARAWQVSTRTGAPLAPALEHVAEALTADTALRRLVAGELSAPRATGRVMAVLPLLGIGIGYAIGGDPLEFLLATAWGWGCLVVGVGLAAAGALWIEALASRAEAS